MGRKLPLLFPFLRSVFCLISKYLLFHCWNSLLWWHVCWASACSKHLSSCHTTMVTNSSPLSKNFYTGPFFPVLLSPLLNCCSIPPSYHCILVCISRDSLCTSFSELPLISKDSLASLLTGQPFLLPSELN